MASTLTRATKSLVTLAVLAMVLVVMGVYGWHALTRPFPGRVVAASCEDTTVSAGDQLSPQQVTVSVLNASTNQGLAGRTLTLFTDAGFAEGRLGNAPATEGDTPRLAIWTSDRSNPAVRLVRSRLPGKVVFRDMSSDLPGVVVVVGESFDELDPGRDSVKVKQDATICSPTG